MRSTEWEQYQTIYKEGAYDLWMLGWYPDYPDADDYLSPFLVDGGFFQNGYHNDEANELVAHEQGSTDHDARLEDFEKLQDIAARDVPFIPSWVGNNAAVYGSNGMRRDGRGDPRPGVHLPALDDHKRQLGESLHRQRSGEGSITTPPQKPA